MCHCYIYFHFLSISNGTWKFVNQLKWVNLIEGKHFFERKKEKKSFNIQHDGNPFWWKNPTICMVKKQLRIRSLLTLIYWNLHNIIFGKVYKLMIHLVCLLLQKDEKNARSNWHPLHSDASKDAMITSMLFFVKKTIFKNIRSEFAVYCARSYLFFSFVIVLSHAKNLSMIFIFFCFPFSWILRRCWQWTLMWRFTLAVINHFVFGGDIFNMRTARCEIWDTNIRCNEIFLYHYLKSFCTLATINTTLISHLAEQTGDKTKPNWMNETKTKFIGEDKP